MNSVYGNTKLRSNSTAEHTSLDHTNCAKTSFSFSMGIALWPLSTEKKTAQLIIDGFLKIRHTTRRIFKQTSTLNCVQQNTMLKNDTRFRWANGKKRQCLDVYTKSMNTRICYKTAVFISWSSDLPMMCVYPWYSEKIPVISLYILRYFSERVCCAFFEAVRKFPKLVYGR